MSDLRQCSREFLREFIEIYRECDSLWKVKSFKYLNKDLKRKSYEKLREKYLEIDKEATVEKVKKKINSLRTNFRVELKKVLKSKKSGAGEEEIYCPTLWYYDELLFLTDQETPRENVSSRSSNILSNLESEDSIELISVDDSSVSNVSNISRKNNNEPSKRKRSQNTAVEEARKVLQQVEKKLNEGENECDIYGKHVSCELKALPLEDRRYVKKVINDALFEASIGKSKQISLVVKSEISIPTTNTTYSNINESDLTEIETPLATSLQEFYSTTYNYEN